MANNTITVNFVPCASAPASGYKIFYRPVGSGGAYRERPNVFASPAVFVDTNDAPGTEYEGYLQSDCGGGKLGPQIPWTTGGGGGGSDSGSSGPPPVENIQGLISNDAPGATIDSVTIDGVPVNFLSGISDLPMPAFSSGTFDTTVNGGSVDVVVTVSGGPAASIFVQGTGGLGTGANQTFTGAGVYTFIAVQMNPGAFDWIVQLVGPE